ncbi:MAG: Hsp20/alpha crystallin family protein [Anaerolineae bacterium]|nr:Hsp20/alpha crystallin family protein [Anaerolineae bacterium]
MTNQLSNWNPLRDLLQLNEAFDRMYNDLGNRTTNGGAARPVYRLPIDAYSTDDAIVIEAAMAGVDPNEVDITIDGDSLTIRAEVRRSEGEDRTYVLRERAYGVLERTLTLNVPVEVDKVNAQFNDGVLTLTVPKAESVKPRKISVNVAK